MINKGKAFKGVQLGALSDSAAYFTAVSNKMFEINSKTPTMSVTLCKIKNSTVKARKPDSSTTGDKITLGIK